MAKRLTVKPNPLFSPQSTYWRVNREWLISLAGPRSVLLELAHPAVAAGVAHHSNYRGDPLGRLYRTMKTMTEISFGTEAEMRAGLKHFHKCHARVRSSDSCPASGVTYDARDPQLQLWVWATLVDSVPRVYERFVTPLTFLDKCAYYDDCVRLAHLLGISRNIIPSNFTEFNEYMDAMLDGETLHVTQEGRKVVDALFGNTLRGKMTRLFSAVAVDLLPPRLREEFGFTWDETRAQRVERLSSISRRVRPWLPNALATHPKAWLRERELR